MTDTDLIDSPAPTDTANGKPQINLRAQYIKDLSFESPRAPASLFTTREAPAVEISVNLGAQRLEQQAVELAFQIAVRAVSDKTTLFLIDMVYAGVFEIQNIADDQLEQTVFVQGANQLFPFARRVIADLTRDGGFPPIMLEPMDFVALYESQRNQMKA
jgi:preprotein translocase subunit SecB